MEGSLKRRLITYLSQFAMDNRIRTFERVLSERTRYITVALENIFQPHNTSAVLRTMECLGVQDAHIIENKYEYRVNPDVVLGASKWLTLNRYKSLPDNTAETIAHLRGCGYRIVATSPLSTATPLEAFDAAKGKAAIFFGTELEGLSGTVLDQADELLQIPISGFTESFNISVSAAIILYNLTHRLRQSDISWALTEDEKDDLRLTWLKGSVRHSDLLIRRYLEGKDGI